VEVKKTNKTRKVVPEEEDEDEDDEAPAPLTGFMSFLTVVQSHAERLTEAQQAERDAVIKRADAAALAAYNKTIVERERAHRQNVDKAAANLLAASNTTGIVTGLAAALAVASGGLSGAAAASAANGVAALSKVVNMGDLGDRVRIGLLAGGAGGAAIHNAFQSGSITSAEKSIKGVQGEVSQFEAMRDRLQKERTKLKAKEEPNEAERERIRELKQEIKRYNEAIEAKTAEKDEIQALVNEAKLKLQGESKDGVDLFQALTQTKFPASVAPREARAPVAHGQPLKVAAGTNKGKKSVAGEEKGETEETKEQKPLRSSTRAAAPAPAASGYDLPAKLADAEKLLTELGQKTENLQASLNRNPSPRVLAQINKSIMENNKKIDALTAHIEELKAKPAAPARREAAAVPAPVPVAKGKAKAKGEADIPKDFQTIIPAILHFSERGSDKRKQLQSAIQACNGNLEQLQALYIRTRDEGEGEAEAAPVAAAAPKASAAPEANADSENEEAEPPFIVETANLATVLEKLTHIVGDDEDKKQRISDCKGKTKLSCLKKLYTELATEKAEEAKAEYQGEPDNDGKKAAAISAAAAIGMTEDAAEEWLQEPPAGGKRKTRKLPRRRSNRTRRQ
jgi:hypothetical protein